MDKLGNILPRIIRRQPGGSRLLGAQVATAFRTLMGPEVARLCDEVEFRGGILLVTTSSPALAHQLRLDAETIMVRLNQPMTCQLLVRNTSGVAVTGFFIDL